jgi:hypothetical protein
LLYSKDITSGASPTPKTLTIRTKALRRHTSSHSPANSGSPRDLDASRSSATKKKSISTRPRTHRHSVPMLIPRTSLQCHLLTNTLSSLYLYRHPITNAEIDFPRSKPARRHPNHTATSLLVQTTHCSPSRRNQTLDWYKDSSHKPHPSHQTCKPPNHEPPPASPLLITSTTITYQSSPINTCISFFLLAVNTTTSPSKFHHQSHHITSVHASHTITYSSPSLSSLHFRATSTPPPPAQTARIKAKRATGCTRGN